MRDESTSHCGGGSPDYLSNAREKFTAKAWWQLRNWQHRNTRRGITTSGQVVPACKELKQSRNHPHAELIKVLKANAQFGPLEAVSNFQAQGEYLHTEQFIYRHQRTCNRLGDNFRGNAPFARQSVKARSERMIPNGQEVPQTPPQGPETTDKDQSFQEHETMGNHQQKQQPAPYSVRLLASQTQGYSEWPQQERKVR